MPSVYWGCILPPQSDLLDQEAEMDQTQGQATSFKGPPPQQLTSDSYAPQTLSPKVFQNVIL